MAGETHDFDLSGLRLSPGEGRRLRLSTPIEPLLLGSERYAAVPASSPEGDGDGEAAAASSPASSPEGERDGEPARVPVQLSVSRMVGGGYALRLRFLARVSGPCMRCLKAASPLVEVEAREVDRAGGGEELDSPYVHDETLDLAGWARDAFVLALPTQILCREDCQGLCPICALDLNEAPADHHHESAADPRWAKLRELKLE